MSRRRTRKSRLFEAIAEFQGMEFTELSQESVKTVRDLMSCGFLEYDTVSGGMRIIPTEEGRRVLDGE